MAGAVWGELAVASSPDANVKLPALIAAPSFMPEIVQVVRAAAIVFPVIVNLRAVAVDVASVPTVAALLEHFDAAIAGVPTK
jgi:hypothetical protein